VGTRDCEQIVLAHRHAFTCCQSGTWGGTDCACRVNERRMGRCMQRATYPPRAAVQQLSMATSLKLAEAHVAAVGMTP
jgi:hypothetical protein